jgi:RNA polymerase sigma-70 factor (ECF subfamily)
MVVLLMDTADDRELLQRVADRDRAAFGELFRRFAPRLKGYLMQALSAGRAEEVVQEVLLRVWRKAPTYDGSRASPTTWIFTIARNARIDSLRRTGRAEPDPEDPVWVPSAPGAPDEDVDRGKVQSQVREALAELPDEQAEILRRAYMKGQTLSEIADALDIPLGTVKSRVRLAMKKLRLTLPAPTD